VSRPRKRITRCRVNNPRSNSVLFEGQFLSLPSISLYTRLSIPHLSQVFSGRKEPSLRACRLIASALNQDLPEFIRALEKHTARIRPYYKSHTGRPPKKEVPEPTVTVIEQSA
jgi:transcriptional regulator with XRE-family HTH domain